MIPSDGVIQSHLIFNRTLLPTQYKAVEVYQLLNFTCEIQDQNNNPISLKLDVQICHGFGCNSAPEVLKIREFFLNVTTTTSSTSTSAKSGTDDTKVKIDLANDIFTI